jgi:hypothetical protein
MVARKRRELAEVGEKQAVADDGIIKEGTPSKMEGSNGRWW